MKTNQCTLEFSERRKVLKRNREADTPITHQRNWVALIRIIIITKTGKSYTVIQRDTRDFYDLRNCHKT